MKLCCYFNYAPHYREAVFRNIDQTFDTQFYFGRDLGMGANSIKKIEYNLFKNTPIEFENKLILGKLLWRTKLVFLPLKRYDTFLLTGDLCFSYIPFLMLARLLNKRVYAWGHGIKKLCQDRTDKFTHRLFSKLAKWLINHYDGYFTYGERGKERMVKLGFNENKLYPIYNSLNDGVIEENNCKLLSNVYKDYFGNDNPVLLFIGRLTPVKKLDWVIKCVKSLEHEAIDCNLVFIGDGTEMVSLQECATKLGLNRKVWFYGECHDETVLSELLFNADLCVSPGDVGLTVIHALTYGLPTISNDDFETQMPEYETIVNGKTGFLFQKNDYDDFCEKVKQWLMHYSANRLLIRQNCYEIINTKFNAITQVEILKRVL